MTDLMTVRAVMVRAALDKKKQNSSCTPTAANSMVTAASADSSPQSRSLAAQVSSRAIVRVLVRGSNYGTNSSLYGS